MKELTEGQMLKKAREAAGHTLVSLAKIIGISPGYLSDIENGRKMVTDKIILLGIEKGSLSLWDLAQKRSKEVTKNYKDLKTKYLKQYPRLAPYWEGV